MSELLERTAATILGEAARTFASVVLTGPRQSGKKTLLVHRGHPSRLFFWRTSAGHEVDFVLEDGQTLIPIEAKLTTAPTPRDAAGIEQLQTLLGRRASRGYVVCLCAERHLLTRRVEAVPLGAF